MFPCCLSLEILSHTNSTWTHELCSICEDFFSLHCNLNGQEDQTLQKVLPISTGVRNIHSEKHRLTWGPGTTALNLTLTSPNPEPGHLKKWFTRVTSTDWLSVASLLSRIHQNWDWYPRFLPQPPGTAARAFLERAMEHSPGVCGEIATTLGPLKVPSPKHRYCLSFNFNRYASDFLGSAEKF